MSLPLITFDGVRISFHEDVDQLRISYPRFGQRTASLSGKIERLIERQECWFDVRWQMLVAAGVSDATARRRLRQLESWALSGQNFEFARDAAENANTTLAAQAAAGSTTIGLAAAGSVTTGSLYVLRSLRNIEEVHVATVSASTLTLTEPLHFQYAVGARFRSQEFLTARLRSGGVIVEREPLDFDVDLLLQEDVNGLAT